MKISKDLSIATLHPRENLFITGVLGALNAEVQLPADWCSTVLLDLRDTFSLTVQVQWSVDGTNWVLIPVRPMNTWGAYVSGIVGTTQGMWWASCAGFRFVRAIVTAFTSGSTIAILMADNSPFNNELMWTVTPALVTATWASWAAVTLTIPSPGAWLRNYVTYLRIVRYAAAVLTASATPVLISTTNIPWALVFTIPADAAALGSVYNYQEDFSYPIVSSAQATATTIVCPVATWVIWRATAWYYVAP